MKTSKKIENTDNSKNKIVNKEETNKIIKLFKRTKEQKNFFYFENLTDDCFFDVTGSKKEFIDFYTKIIKSGVGTIITGGVYLGYNENKNNRLSRISLDENIMSCYKKITQLAHSVKAKIFLQVKSIYGRFNHLYNTHSSVKIASNFGIDPTNKQRLVFRISDGKCNEMLNDFSRIVILSNIAGFDGILIDASIDNVIGELSSPEYNKRVFGYFSNVTDFLSKALKQIDAKNNTIFVKLSLNYQSLSNNKSDDNMFNLIKIINVIKKLVSQGVDGFEFVFGNYDKPFNINFNEIQNDLLFFDFIKQIRNELESQGIKNKFNEDVKLFYHDNFNNFDNLSEKLENINVDLVDVTKNLYSDTNFINQLINKNNYQNCIKCSFCNQKQHFNNKICCAINPHLVDFDNLKINGDKKEVAVVGSGLSGLICSMILAKRNYIVHLYEQNSEVNHIGKLMTIFGTNKSLESYHKYIENELDKYIKNKQIILFLNTKFKPSIEKNHHYNSIVIATGFKSKLLSIVGAVQSHVHSIYDVLKNKKLLNNKNNIVIYAKSILSLKLALYLKQNYTINLTIIIKDTKFIFENKNANLFYYFYILFESGSNFMFLSRISKINEDNIDVITYKNFSKNSYNFFLKLISNEKLKMEKQQQNIDCDLLIYEPEIIPNSELYIELVNSKFSNEIYVVGNALYNCDLSDIVHDAYFVGKNL